MNQDFKFLMSLSAALQSRYIFCSFTLTASWRCLSEMNEQLAVISFQLQAHQLKAFFITLIWKKLNLIYLSVHSLMFVEVFGLCKFKLL